jgi:serine/threonine-protein kinase RsbW
MGGRIVVPAYLENLSIVSDFVQEQARAIHLPSRKTWELLLVMDEICSQIIQYMDFDQQMGSIGISWENNPEFVTLTVEANGLPFNPLDVNKYNSESESEEQTLGGMGIYLVSKMVDGVHYERCGNSNVLKIVKYRRTYRKNGASKEATDACPRNCNSRKKAQQNS